MRARGDLREVLEHLSSWERAFWEMLQEQKEQTRVESRNGEPHARCPTNPCEASG